MQCDGKASVAQNSQNSLVEIKTNISPTSQTPNAKTSPDEKKRVPGRERKMDKETLAKRVEPVDENAAQIIRAENTQIQQTETPFLRSGEIYKVSKFAPTRPLTLFVGTSGDNYTALIGGDAEKYFEFVKKAGVTLDGGEMRKIYLLNFLEVTKPGGKRLQILESVEDLRQRPNLKDEDKQKFVEFREKYESVIRPIKQVENGSYEVYAVKDQDLVRLNLTVKPDGLVEKQETVLERNLLIPYAM